MRIVFFGSPEFALPSLEALLATRHEVVGVVSQPDRPAGRGHGQTPPPVKVAATQHGLPVLQPDNVSAPDSVEALRALDPDVFVVAAYGQILRQRVLDIPKRGCLNVHASLLPRHRGASPVSAAILAGDPVTGVTIMEMERGLDTGPIVSQRREMVLASDTTGTLEDRLARTGAELLVETLDAWARGDMIATPQDEALATYAPQLKRREAELDWALPARDLWRRVRAFSPWPIAFTRWRGEELRILEAWPLPGDSQNPPGSVLAPYSFRKGPPAAGQARSVETLERRPLIQESTPDEPHAVAGGVEETFSVQTGSGALAVLRLQRPGKRALSGLEFLRGQRDFVGSRLGD
ncbi:MAG TPA: methionyl-tRNA formyltransferase [Dehalococcoidia bacterium]|nr:methionyl-tRNA formyltransferase [Dehalococcoidia bacterium]